MSEITLLEVWRDTGFTEGAVEVPKVGQTLSNPNFTFDDGLYPSKNRLFSQFKVEGAWYDLFDCSYLRMTLEVNNPRTIGEQSTNTITLYGWIDSIALNSDNDDKPMTVIDWHIDYWRTYSNSAHYGYGMVTRRPKGDNDPIQSMSYRYRLPGEFTSMAYTGPGSNLLWVYIPYVKKVDENQVTVIRTAVIPVNPSNVDATTYFKVGNGPTRQSMAFSNVIDNKFDEKLGISPTVISAVYISRVPPFEIDSGDGSQASPIVFHSGSSEYQELKYYADTSKAVNNVTQNGTFTVEYTKGSAQSGLSYQEASTAIRQNHLGRERGLFTYRLNEQSHIAEYDYIYVNTVDDYIKDVIGDEKWNILRNGDTVTVPASTKRADNVTINMTTPTAGHFRADVTADLSDLTTLTFNGSTFGDFNILNTSRAGFTLRHTTVVYAGDIDVATEKSSPPADSYFVFSRSGAYYQFSQTLPSAVTTTDSKEWVFTDMSGVPVGSLPWGISCKDYNIRNIVTSTGGYLEYRFGDIDSHSMGTCFRVALPAVDLSSNSWSDYVYSGQRDYDMAQRDIANKQALASGIASAFTGGISNAVLAGFGRRTETIYGYGWPGQSWSMATDGSLGELETIMNAQSRGRAGMYGANIGRGYDMLRLKNVKAEGLAPVMAGASGIGIGVLGSALEYGLNNVFNAELQRAQDALSAKQLDSISIYGSGLDWFTYGRQCGLISLVADDYSLNKFNTDITLNGIICSEPISDCDTMIKLAEGPLQVTGLIITGDIPVQAKYAIRDKLASGVRLI